MIKGDIIKTILILFLIILSTSTIFVYTMTKTNSVIIFINAVNNKGNNIDNIYIQLYELTGSGAKLVSHKYISQNNNWIAIAKPNKVKNFHIIVSKLFGNEALIGSKTFSITPSVKNEIQINVNLKRLNYNIRDIQSISVNNGQLIGSTDEYATVLEFFVQDNIKVYWNYPIDTKFALQRKARFWIWNDETGEYEPTQWEDAGYTIVSLDRGIGSSNPLTKKHCIIKMKFHYVDIIFATQLPGIYEEIVYAIDTETDGYYYQRILEPWNGGAPSSYRNTAITYQGDHRTFRISKAYSYLWNNTISMDVSYPWSNGPINIFVPLRVNKASTSYATLIIHVPNIGGNSYVKSYDIKGGWLKSYHIWINP